MLGIAGTMEAGIAWASPIARAGTKAVDYAGYTFSVPATWPVYRLGPGSTRCVRYNTSAVYLGTPGQNQRCPARLVGQADTISIRSSSRASTSSGPGRRARPVVELQSAEVPAAATAHAGPGPGLSVSVTYGADPGTVRRILRSFRNTRTGAPAVIHQSAPAAAASAPPAPSASPPFIPSSPAPGLPSWEQAWLRAAQLWYTQAWAYYLSQRPPPVPKPPAPPTPAPTGSATPTPTPSPTGKGGPKPSAPPKPSRSPKPSGSPKPTPRHSTVPSTHLKVPGATPLPGFDTCTAPSLKTMRAWRRSFSAAAIYIGGVERACDYGNLSASWVRSVTAMGWSLIPLYVGLQAPCNDFSQEINRGKAAPEGAGAARGAALDARSLGLGEGTPIYFDMEGYNNTDKSCRNSVLSFLNQWTTQLHDLGYISGVYSSAASGAEDLGTSTSVYGHPLAKPDSMWFALWDNEANLIGTPYLQNSWWNPGRRIKQYEGPHWRKVGGIGLDIDSDWVQGPVY